MNVRRVYNQRFTAVPDLARCRDRLLSRLHTSKFSLTSVIDDVHMLMCMNAKFSLTSFSLTSFICWCERINKFSLTSFQCSQQYNYTVDEKTITTTRRQFRFFSIGHAYLTREKRLLARGRGCALLMQYEHSKRHMNRRWWVRPRATQRRSQSQGFASNSVHELREEDEGRFHNFFRSLQYDILNITTTRPLCARNFL